MSRRQYTNQLGGIHKPCGPVGGGCKGGLSKVHMVEEGGLSKFTSVDKGGGQKPVHMVYEWPIIRMM